MRKPWEILSRYVISDLSPDIDFWQLAPSLTMVLYPNLRKGYFGFKVWPDDTDDTVDHMILLQKLYHYGVRGCAHDWFTSYLSNRSQFVTYNGVKYNLNNVKCGVPQGSILGPLLFLLYINDLSFACKRTFPVLFADDSNLFLSGKNTDQVQQMINDELKDIVIWLRANKLSLNISKPHYMLFSNKKVIQPNVTIEMVNL